LYGQNPKQKRGLRVTPFGPAAFSIQRQESVGGSAEEFTRFVGAASAQFARLVKGLNIKSE